MREREDSTASGKEWKNFKEWRGKKRNFREDLDRKSAIFPEVRERKGRAGLAGISELRFDQLNSVDAC